MNAMNVTYILLVSPETGFRAMKRAVVPHFLIPGGITVSCFELRAPCIRPLNTLEDPRVTIIAGSLKYPMNNPLNAPRTAPITKAIAIGSAAPPW